MKLKVYDYDNHILISGSDGETLFEIGTPVELEIWNGTSDKTDKVSARYTKCKKESDKLICIGETTDHVNGSYTLKDVYYPQDNGTIRLDRSFTVNDPMAAKGIRVWCTAAPLPQDRPLFRELRYFAPPAIFDKNDLDDDGLEDYFLTDNLMYREDRMNYPKFMAYSEKEKLSLWMQRAELPRFDSIPDRELGQTMFLQKTDIGSLGVWSRGYESAQLRAAYPFYEGEASIGLYISKSVPFGAFWPANAGEEFCMSYQFGADKQDNYNTACWESIRKIIKENTLTPVELPVSIDKIVEYRLEALDRYYLEFPEDEGCPAGFVLNCHPQKGEQLENIIQYGFTGQNILNAYNMMRYGYEHNIPGYVDHALKTTEFFANQIHIPESGMFYNLYNTDTGEFNFWWTGLLLPLAYAKGEELERLMGPLYRNKKEVVDRLAQLKGSYLRCMNEDVTALLRIYRYELDRGNSHQNWIDAVLRYCEFLLRTQEEDGSWYRAYDTDGAPITEPEIWFGGTIYEKKSSTSTSIPLLVEMYEYTGEQKYLDSAKRAGYFAKKYPIDHVKYNGGVHDSIYRKGQLIDNESMLYPMFGMLALYKATKEQIFLDGAVDAAHFCASWVCLWDVPLPETSTLAKYGFRSLGIGACDTCGAGYVHMFQLLCVPEIVEISILSNDKELFETAKLYWYGCNQTVALPENDWGYRYYGLQEEGYLVSWFATDDPMFATDTGFGHRWKGEGNKTCFPWIQGVSVGGYWKMKDLFKTLDFDEIEKKYFVKM